MEPNHHAVIREQFSKQAARFGEKGLTLTSHELLGWAADNLSLQTHAEVLDVAAGTGLLSRAIAPHVRRVVAVDLTLEMLLQGRHEAEQEGIGNIFIVQGLAENLPHPNNFFDMAITRLSLHHFRDPRIQIKEMVRVCRPRGEVAVIDLISPDDEALAVTYNRLERMRDPSHTRALSATELIRVMQDAGLNITHMDSREVEVDVHRWMDLTRTNPETQQTILEELTRELEGVCTTGMRPFMRDDKLMFVQTWVTVAGVK